MLNKTYLPDKRAYETYNDKDERDRRINELKRKWAGKMDYWEYRSISWKIYYIAYKE